MTKIIFGIVTFREKYWETPSFNSLLSSAKKLSEPVTIFIFDNTDAENWDADAGYNSDEKITISYVHHPENPGISAAYNTIAKFAKEHHFSHIVFLDQDTELPEDFCLIYSKVADSAADIAAPLIYENGNLLSPGIYKNYRSYSYESIQSDSILLKNNSCINSGLMIKTNFFFKAGGYNQSLRLDFCDHEFIARVGNFTESLKIIPTKLEQNFSTNTNPLDKALFRYKLYIKDMKAFKKINNYDYKVTLFVDLPHLFRLTLQYRSLAFMKQRFFLKTK